MPKKIKLSLVVIFTVSSFILFTPKGNMQTKGETAGQKFKGIKVLNDGK